MPVLAPIAAAAATAASAIGAGIAALTVVEGVMLAGAALSTVGTLTKSKTLTQIGTGLTLAGGIGSVASNTSKASSASSVTGSNAAKSTNILEVDNIDNILATDTKGAASAADLSNFKPDNSIGNSMAAYQKSASSIGDGADNFNVRQGFMNRANNTLTRYNPLVNIAGGAADFYQQNSYINSREKMQKRDLDFQQREIDRINRNVNGTPQNPLVTPGRVSVNPTAYNGILRRN